MRRQITYELSIDLDGGCRLKVSSNFKISERHLATGTVRGLTGESSLDLELSRVAPIVLRTFRDAWFSQGQWHITRTNPREGIELKLSSAIVEETSVPERGEATAEMSSVMKNPFGCWQQTLGYQGHATDVPKAHCGLPVSCSAASGNGKGSLQFVP